ncbi:MAG: dihydrodipicolinate reductase [Actinomycetota bacterium]|nr:dihydrodipicolinate reductase [Actinomycetota bacterium]
MVYRVVQWATGNIGTRALRAVIEHPDMELVGLYVHSPEKAGRDAGDLCGLPPVGVAATTDVEKIVALGPDCVLYMADRVDADSLCRLLAAGINVVSTRAEFHRPESMEPDLRGRLEQACRKGRSTLHSTGSSPGFITEAVPIVLASIQRRLDCVTISEFADMSSRNSPGMIFRLMGFGRPPDRFDPSAMAGHGAASFGPSLGVVADAIGTPLDELRSDGSVAVATRAVEVAAGRVEAGTVAAQRMEITGLRRGRPLLRFRANWYLTRELDPAWDLRPTGWRIEVEGDAPLDVAIHFPVPDEEWAATSPGLTAHRPVNAVPYVCAAPPGIRTSVELPQIVARFGGPDD